eukprot:scaffold295279_cov14-Tisochrysis_lutea.AAC.1
MKGVGLNGEVGGGSLGLAFASRGAVRIQMEIWRRSPFVPVYSGLGCWKPLPEGVIKGGGTRGVKPKITAPLKGAKIGTMKAEKTLPDQFGKRRLVGSNSHESPPPQELRTEEASG